MVDKVATRTQLFEGSLWRTSAQARAAEHRARNRVAKLRETRKCSAPLHQTLASLFAALSRDSKMSLLARYRVCASDVVNFKELLKVLSSSDKRGTKFKCFYNLSAQ